MKEELGYVNLPLEVEIPSNLRDFNKGLMFRESLENNKGMLFIFERVGKYSFYMKNTTIPLDVAFVSEEGIVDSIKELEPNNEEPVYSDGQVLFAIEANRGWFAENNVEIGDEIVLGEAKVDTGRSDYGKASIRNYRRSGPGHGEPAMFDLENKRGKLIDKRREEHKARRGVKGAKVPAYKLGEAQGYHKVKSRYSVWPSAYAEGALLKYRKKSEEYISEEGYDRMRDDRLVKYGIGHDGSDRKGPSPRPTGKRPKGKTVYQKQAEKKYGKGATALDIVKAKIKAKHGDGAIMGEDVKRDEYGDPIGGPKISEKQKKKNLEKDEPDMKITRSEEIRVKKPQTSDWRNELEEVELDERVGGVGTLVRQGVKVGGKKGGKAVQKGQAKAIAAGQGAKEAVKGGNKSKMVGSGRGEKIGAVIGGTAGALAGGILDGPVSPVGDIIGGIAGGKVGGKIGRQFDKMGAKKSAKKSVKEGKNSGVPEGIAGAAFGPVGSAAAGAITAPKGRKKKKAIGAGLGAAAGYALGGGPLGAGVGGYIGGRVSEGSVYDDPEFGKSVARARKLSLSKDPKDQKKGREIDKANTKRMVESALSNSMRTKNWKQWKQSLAKEGLELSEAPAKVPLKPTGNWLQDRWNEFVPPRESSNNPNVRSGVRQPDPITQKGLDVLNKGAETVNAPIKATSSTIKNVKSTVDKVKDFLPKAQKALTDVNTAKAAVKGVATIAGPAAAGLAVSKGVDALMKRGKKKTQKESVSNWRDELGYE